MQLLILPIINLFFVLVALHVYIVEKVQILG